MTTDNRLKLFSYLWLITLIADRDYVYSTSYNIYFAIIGLCAFLIKKDKHRFYASVALQLFSTLLSSPSFGNHILVQTICGMSLLTAFIFDKMTQNDNKFLNSSLISFQYVILVFYGMVTFHKLNSGFFDLHSTCALALNNKILNIWGFELPKNNFIASLLIMGTLMTEGLVPVFVFIKKYSLLAMSFLILFHLYLSANYFEFLPVVLTLFLSVIDNEHIDKITRFIQKKYSNLLVIIMTSTLAIIHKFSYFLVDDLKKIILAISGTILALIISIPFLNSFWNLKFKNYSQFEKIVWPSKLWVLLLIIFTLFPYANLKTTSSLAMYSNLRTEEICNHFVMPSLQFFPERTQVVQLSKTFFDSINVDKLYFLKTTSKKFSINSLQLGKISLALQSDDFEKINNELKLQGTNLEILQQKYLSLNFFEKLFLSYHPYSKDDSNACYW